MPTQSDWVCVHGRRWRPTDCLCEVTDLVLHHQDPLAQLQKLAKQQSDALLKKLGGEGDEGREWKRTTQCALWRLPEDLWKQEAGKRAGDNGPVFDRSRRCYVNAGG